jgi:uncharacterized MAPEG superfamily protein
MTPELAVLVVCALLSLALALLTVAIHFQRFGGKMIRGNRDDFPPLDGLAARVVRAHQSLNEALLPFSVLVVAVVLAHASSGITSCAAVAFGCARFGHAAFYVAGATPWRSLTFYAGLVATFTLACQLPWQSVV